MSMMSQFFYGTRRIYGIFVGVQFTAVQQAWTRLR